MGVKGRDLALWAFFLLAGPALFFPRDYAAGPAAALVACAALFWWHHLAYLPGARCKSRKLGLRHVVLLPVPVWWATFLIRISDGRVKAAGVKRAFEVHVEAPRGLTASGFCRLLERDLDLANRLFPGCLFLWETSAPLPATFRALVRREAAAGRAFWKRGGWRVPGFPSCRKRKGTLRRGAVVAPGSHEAARS